MKAGIHHFLLPLILGILVFSLVTISCGDDDDDDDDSDSGTGTLQFVTNGESFIVDGFVGKTGWSIAFDHFYVNIYGPTAYQVAETDEEQEFAPPSSTTEAGVSPLHAGHPHNDIPEGAAHESLLGEYWVDLHIAGTDSSNAVLLDEITDAPVGNYNYINFVLKQTEEGDHSGYSIVMLGTATKDGETIAFTIKLNEQMLFESCHQEIDDEYAGVVEKGGVGSLEMTFHSDHLFGDIETLDDPDGVNPGAIGFQPFADLAVDGVVDIDQDQMSAQLSTDDYTTFLAALHTLGHSGEGHCGYEEWEAEAEE